MTKAEYRKMLEMLRKGDNTFLSFLHTFQPYCIKGILIKSRGKCSEEEAYDLFIDSVLDFRKNVLQGKEPDYRYLRAYLNKICLNKWMAASRSRDRIRSKQAQIQEELYEGGAGNYDHLEAAEQQQEQQKEQSQLLEKVILSLKSLSGKCQKILQMAIVEERPMKEIAVELGLANANVAKTTKSRCYNRLMKKMTEQHG